MYCTGGPIASNDTAPGPRYFVHVSCTGGGRLRGTAIVPLAYLASSVTHTGNATQEDSDVDRDGAVSRRATGPWIEGPFSSSLTSGGVFLTATSEKGVTG